MAQSFAACRRKKSNFSGKQAVLLARLFFLFESPYFHHQRNTRPPLTGDSDIYF